MWANWFLYATLGTLLFFMPLLPLRPAMVHSKRSYISAADARYRRAASEYERAVSSGSSGDESAARLQAIAGLIKSAEEMSVWPFDRSTFRRFASVVVFPVLPVLVERLSPALAKVIGALH